MKTFYRPTWITIHLDAIEKNIEQIQQLHPKKALFAVVKANAYGHGDIEVSRIALKAGAKGLAVSSLDEALHLRQAQIEAPILVLGATLPEDSFVAAKHQVSLTVTSLEWVEKALPYLSNHSLSVHLKLNTGMNRLGVEDAETVSLLFERLTTHPKIHLEGIFTHFATADEETDFMSHQIETFQTFIQSLDLSDVRYIHVSNTAATLHHAFSFDQALRVGLGLYGVYPTCHQDNLSLKSALTLQTQLTQVRWLEAGEFVGYGATYQASQGHWMGVLPIGYADGWWRMNQGRSVVIEGIECPIIGRVCMDQCMVALPHRMTVGTPVTLIGKEMPVERVASELQTIPYEVFCSLSDRIPRIYVYQGKEIACDSMRFKNKA